jgi:hypothetical protein
MPLMHGDGSMGRTAVRRVTHRNVDTVPGFATRGQPQPAFIEYRDPGKCVYKRPPGIRLRG